jgi:hypothetical protein
LLPRLWPAVLTLGWILLVIAAGQGVMALLRRAHGTDDQVGSVGISFCPSP